MRVWWPHRSRRARSNYCHESSGGRRLQRLSQLIASGRVSDPFALKNRAAGRAQCCPVAAQAIDDATDERNFVPTEAKDIGRARDLILGGAAISRVILCMRGCRRRECEEQCEKNRSRASANEHPARRPCRDLRCVAAHAPPPGRYRRRQRKGPDRRCRGPVVVVCMYHGSNHGIGIIPKEKVFNHRRCLAIHKPAAGLWG